MSIVLPASLGACTVGPNFHPPRVAAPNLWGSERTDVPSRTVASDVDPHWWRVLADPELSSLIDRLVAQNLDLEEAAERINQGRAQRRIRAAQGLPHVEERTTYNNQRLSPNGFLSLVTPAPYAPFQYDDWQNSLSFSWELDLFGRVRRGVEAENANTQAVIEDRRGIALSLLAELARDYVELRGTQARISLAEENLQLSEENTRLVQDRSNRGVANTLDLAQARAQRDSIASAVPMLHTEEASLVNAIGLLLAEPPRALEAELHPSAPIPGVPPVVAIGVPGTLVRRRPDVGEAEARLHAATAETGVAIAAFYPDISLSGMVGADGRIIGNAFSLPDRAWQIGPQLSIPLFEGGQLRGQLQLRRSQQREAALNFQRVVLQAWQDVDNALTAYTDAQRRHVDIADAVRQNEVALGLARRQYALGVADFLNVVSSQAQLLQSQDQLSISSTEITVDLVTLYRALGGGWEVAEHKPATCEQGTRIAEVLKQ